jgi:hypothetical protein
MMALTTSISLKRVVVEMTMSELSEKQRNVRRAVKQNINHHRNPVVTTEEVAEEQDLPVEVALSLLRDEPTVSAKEVGDHYVWW